MERVTKEAINDLIRDDVRIVDNMNLRINSEEGYSKTRELLIKEISILALTIQGGSEYNGY